MKKYYFNFNLRTDVGLVRESNEDAIAGTYSTLVVADGVGGEPDGERASSYVVEEIIKAVSSDDFNPFNTKIVIEDAVHKARVRLHQGYSWGNTTMVVSSIEQDVAHIAHVGDSRGYLFRDGKLSALTKDHSYVQRLVEFGEITEEEALYHPYRNIIEETIHSEIYKPARIEFSMQEIKEGDLIILCTDGLTDLILDKDIEKIINDNLHDGLSAVNDALINAAFTIEDDELVAGKDNITIAIGEVVPLMKTSVFQEPEIYTFYEEKE